MKSLGRFDAGFRPVTEIISLRYGAEKPEHSERRTFREPGFQTALQLPDYSRRIRNMAIEQHCERSSQDTPPRRSFRRRIGLWMDLLKFAWVRGRSLQDRIRLFYYTGPKLSLVSRGWSRHVRSQ